VRIVADAPLYAVSSTALRAELKAWKPMGERLPAEVLSYIRQHRLYEGE
jgi:nicotinic acid mononucleotide adenylyltransferase